MTREQFLNELDKELGFLSFSERRDVLNDYVAHFAAAMQDGKSESQICEDLGSIREIASSYRTTKQEPVAEEKTAPKTEEGTKSEQPKPVIPNNIREDVKQDETIKAEPAREVFYAEKSKAAEEILAKSKRKSITGYNVGVIISTVVLFGLIALGLATTLTIFFASFSQTIISLGFFSDKGFAIGSLLFSLGIDFLVGYAIYGLIIGIIKLAKRLAVAFRRNIDYVKGV